MSGTEGKNSVESNDSARPLNCSAATPPERIGPFRIERELGRGAVGVVYLARDTKLDRQVAIKSLPAEVRSDSKVQKRWKREARVLASLNHPNIAAIYEELEELEGVSYLVLEYVPGQTLAELITKNDLALREVLTIALQMAHALAAAHEHGIIHRDLKPGNVKITPDGKVKVLDFGLARSADEEFPGRQTTVTEPGHILGTPAYMSPEQARGKQIDKRSDIWSFACVLFEMLTGAVPFDGETVSDMLANILHKEPDWKKLPDNTPANIVVLMRRCLEKDLNKRLHDIADAAIEINETLNLPATAPPTTTTSFEIKRPTGVKKLIALSMACFFVGIILGILAIRGRLQPDLLQQPTRSFTIGPETSLAMEALWHHALAFSPDGKYLAYVEQGSDGRRRIYLRELDKFQARPLPGTEGAISPFFSPDGQWLAYVDHFQRKLKKVSVKGGEPIVLCDCLQFRGGSWGTDDNIIFTPAGGSADESSLWRISASGEKRERLTINNMSAGEYGHFWPQILPGGKEVLFTSIGSVFDEHQIEVYSLETKKRHPIFKGGSYARYVPTGHLIYGRDETLYAAPFDIKQLKITGPHIPVITGDMTPQSCTAQFAVSPDGSIAYIPVKVRSTELKPVWVDRQGQVETLPGATPRGYVNVRISPDGTQAVFTIQDGHGSDIWIYDLQRHTLNPLTSDGTSALAFWILDGKVLLFGSYRGGSKPQLFRQSMVGSGQAELVATLEEPVGGMTSCSPDGEEFLFVRSDPMTPRFDQDIWILWLRQDGQYSQRPYIHRHVNQREAVWSPCGRWVAYSSDESGRWEIYVEPYPGPGPKILVSTEGAQQPMWSRDGKELFYRSGHRMMAATVETEPQFRVTAYNKLFEGRYYSSVNLQNYDVAPDGRFLMIQETKESAPLEINVVLNWFGELKQLLAVEKNQ